LPLGLAVGGDRFKTCKPLPGQHVVGHIRQAGVIMPAGNVNAGVGLPRCPDRQSTGPQHGRLRQGTGYRGSQIG
jgi:hypothetical protein